MVQPHVIFTKVIIDKLPSVVHKVSGACHYLAEPAEELCLLLALYHLIKLAERIQILMKSQHGTCEFTRVVVDLLGRVYHFLVEDFV